MCVMLRAEIRVVIEHMEEDENTSHAIPKWVELEYSVTFPQNTQHIQFTTQKLIFSTCAPSRAQPLRSTSRTSPGPRAIP